MLLVVAGKGVVDTFYLSPTREALARAASGERLIGVVAVLLLGVSVGLAVTRLTVTASVTAVTAAVFLGVVAFPDETVVTYLMVPVAAVLLAAAAIVDLVRKRV
jgi:hypothetical protein